MYDTWVQDPDLGGSGIKRILQHALKSENERLVEAALAHPSCDETHQELLFTSGNVRMLRRWVQDHEDESVGRERLLRSVRVESLKGLLEHGLRLSPEEADVAWGRTSDPQLRAEVVTNLAAGHPKHPVPSEWVSTLAADVDELAEATVTRLVGTVAPTCPDGAWALATASGKPKNLLHAYSSITPGERSVERTKQVWDVLEGTYEGKWPREYSKEAAECLYSILVSRKRRGLDEAALFALGFAVENDLDPEVSRLARKGVRIRDSRPEEWYVMEQLEKGKVEKHALRWATLQEEPHASEGWGRVASHQNLQPAQAVALLNTVSDDVLVEKILGGRDAEWLRGLVLAGYSKDQLRKTHLHHALGRLSPEERREVLGSIAASIPGALRLHALGLLDGDLVGKLTTEQVAANKTLGIRAMREAEARLGDDAAWEIFDALLPTYDGTWGDLLDAATELARE